MSRIMCGSILVVLAVCSGARAQFTCFGIPDSSPAVCSGHGTCVAEETCSCDAGWSGLQCENPVICFELPSNDPAVCSGHGSCIATDTCSCDAGYTGTECETAICFGLPASDENACSGHGVCIAPDVCQCETGWGGPECSADLSVVPAASTWGLAVMLLALLVAGSVVIIRRPKVTE